MKTAQQIILTTLCGTLGSIIIGLIFFGGSIFSVDRATFQFIGSGFYGSLFFSLLKYRNFRDQVFGFIFILLIQVIIFSGRYASFGLILRDTFYLSSLFISIIIYHQVIYAYNGLKLYSRSFVLAGILGFLNLLSGVLLFMMLSNVKFPPFGTIIYLVEIAALTGLGIALGIDFYLHNSKKIHSIRNNEPGDEYPPFA